MAYDLTKCAAKGRTTNFPDLRSTSSTYQLLFLHRHCRMWHTYHHFRRRAFLISISVAIHRTSLECALLLVEITALSRAAIIYIRSSNVRESPASSVRFVKVSLFQQIYGSLTITSI